MTTIEKMDRHRGHLYNWYDTTPLKPLYPLYVSSVDSGNLAGHLIAVAAACAEWAEAPSVHLQGDFEGILDCVAVLDDSLAELPDDRRQLRPLRQRLRDRIDGHAPRRRDDQDAARDGLHPHHQPGHSCQRNPQARLGHRHRGEFVAQRGPRAMGSPARGTCEAHMQRRPYRRRDAWRRCAQRLLELRERTAQIRLRDGLLVPAAAGAQAAVHRLPRRGAPARRKLLRPARLRSPADQPVRHRQGRSSDRALVPPRPPDRRDRLPRRADVLVRLDVRISDAAAGDEGAAGRHPQPDQQAGRSGSRSSTAARRASRGGFRKPPTTAATPS